MAPNVQVGGNALIVDASIDATALVGGNVLIVDARVDATALVAGVALLVDAVPSPEGAITAAFMHYARMNNA